MNSATPVSTYPPQTVGNVATSGRVGLARGLSLAALLALAPKSGAAQDAVQIGDQVTCPGCVIEVGSPVALAPPKDHVYFMGMPPPLVARDRGGNYILTRIGGDASVAVFAADGSFRSSHGTTGLGPGEFGGMPTAIAVGENDVLHMVSPPHLHTLAARADSSLDQVRLPFVAHAAVVLKSGIAVQAARRTEAGVTTVQMLEPDGTIRTGIEVVGTSTPESVLSNDTNLRRLLGRSNDGSDLWIAPFDRYQVVRYSPEGEEKTRIERVSEWFPAYTGARGGLGSIHQDADGLLWIAIHRPASSAPPVAEPRSGVEEGPLDSFMDINKVLRTTIEVIDPVAGQLVARRDLDEVVTIVATPGDEVFVYSLHPDALGDLDCVIRPLRLQRP